MQRSLANVKPLPDGLLVTRAQQLRVQSAEWTVLVVIDNPKLDPGLVRNINLVMAQAKKAVDNDIIARPQSTSWTGRLKYLKSSLAQGLVLPPKSQMRRFPRGWFNILGQIGHTLFGLATDDSIAECRRAISQSQLLQQDIVHQVNKLTTVLNRTQGIAAWNQHKISQVTDFISGKLIPTLNQATAAINTTQQEVYRLERAFYFERIVSTLEQITSSYINLLHTYARQKASLELGRLTEDILSPSQLRDVLQMATTSTAYPIEPIQWYYEHTHVYPVWGKDTLLYRVKLPLVDGYSYNRYHLATWPVPYPGQGYSIQILVDHPDVGLSTTNGDIFHPTGCMGWRPMVCRSGPLYNAQRWSCPRTLISGDVRHSHTCKVRITQQFNLTQVTEISYGEYIAVTWGETLETRCEGQPGKRQVVNPGTYLITVPSGCVVMGKGVTLTGLIERVGHISVKALQMLTSNILNITEIIPAEQAISLLDQPHFDNRNPFVQTNLQPLPLPSSTFDWTHHGSRISFGVLFILLILIVVAVITGVVIWKKWDYLVSCLIPSKVQSEEAPTVNNESSPSTRPALPLLPSNIYPSFSHLSGINTNPDTTGSPNTQSLPLFNPQPSSLE